MLKKNAKKKLEKSELISIYRTLDKKELRELGKWLASPAHNLRQDVQALHHYLSSGDHLFRTASLEKTRVWRQLFPKEKYDDARMRQTIHFTQKAVEEYLIYPDWQAEDLRKQLALAKQYRQRNLDRSLEKTLKRAERLLKEAPERGEEYFRNEYLLQQEKYALQAIGEGIHDVNLQVVATALDQTYLIEKLRLCCHMLFHQKAYKVQYKINFLSEAIHFVEQHQLSRFPGLGIYYYVIKCLQVPDGEVQSDFFEKLRQTVRENGQLLPWKDQHDIYLMIINICVPYVNTGHEWYTRQAFEWYRMGFEKGVLLENNLMTRYTYLNVVSVALVTKEFDYAASFIAQYRPFLDADQTEDTYSYARARYLYAVGDYPQAMQLLAQATIKHPVYNLLGKTLLLKIYYEEDSLDALDSLLDSMSTYIRRKDLTDAQQRNFDNVVKFTRKMSRLELFDRAKKQALIQEIEQASPLSEKKWMLEQLGKLGS